MSDFDRLGEAIVACRKQLGLTQEALALEANMSPSYLRSIEHGTANPTFRELEKIAGVLELTLAEMFEFAVQPEVTA